jgi:hypothetical protein
LTGFIATEILQPDGEPANASIKQLRACQTGSKMNGGLAAGGIAPAAPLPSEAAERKAV